MDLNKRHHNEQYLYGGTKVATLDNDIKDIKPFVEIQNNKKSINNFLQEQGFRVIQQRLENNSLININNHNDIYNINL